MKPGVYLSPDRYYCRGKKKRKYRMTAGKDKIRNSGGPGLWRECRVPLKTKIFYNFSRKP